MTLQANNDKIFENHFWLINSKHPDYENWFYREWLFYLTSEKGLLWEGSPQLQTNLKWGGNDYQIAQNNTLNSSSKRKYPLLNDKNYIISLGSRTNLCLFRKCSKVELQKRQSLSLLKLLKSFLQNKGFQYWCMLKWDGFCVILWSFSIQVILISTLLLSRGHLPILEVSC